MLLMKITREDQVMLTIDAIASVRALLEDDCHLTVRQLKLLMRNEMMNEVIHSTIRHIICDDLNLRKVAVRWVPQSLTDKLKGQRMEAAINFLQRYSIEGENFLDCIITADKIWIHHYTPPTKKASMVWKAAHEPAPKNSKLKTPQGNSC